MPGGLSEAHEVKAFSISPCRMLSSSSTTHSPFLNCSSSFSHHKASSPPVFRDMMRSSGLLSVTSPTSTYIDEATRTQASLPVKSGGLGIRSAVQLAPSAFLASAAAISDPPYPQQQHHPSCCWPSPRLNPVPATHLLPLQGTS